MKPEVKWTNTKQHKNNTHASETQQTASQKSASKTLSEEPKSYTFKWEKGTNKYKTRVCVLT